MEEKGLFYVLSEKSHACLVKKAFIARGYDETEAESWVRICADATRHGVHSHNAIKAIHLDKVFGSGGGGCIPGADTETRQGRFEATRIWDANKKCGPSVAYQAVDKCIELADEFGVGTVSVNNAFHYLWGGGYVLEAARRGYIAYTCCTALLAEVVPFEGKYPTIGTNPHSWAFPTSEAVGFPILVDWATSAISMGKLQQLKREGKPLPPDCAIDRTGQPTENYDDVSALLPFGDHKGYGLGLIDELIAGFIGGGLPTTRGKFDIGDDLNHSPCFFFKVIHPEALSESFGNSVKNIRAILKDILSTGNEDCLLPGQVEAHAADQCVRAGGLLFTASEIEELNQIADECEYDTWFAGEFPQFER
jgi:L-2-hydroxycarboxylate dehydrogenase (NAD+)